MVSVLTERAVAAPLVRRAQSRIKQATLENEMGNWKDAGSGRRPPIASLSRSGHESIWIHLMNLF